MTLNISKLNQAEVAPKLSQADLKKLSVEVNKLNEKAISAYVKQGLKRLSGQGKEKEANEAVVALQALRAIHDKATWGIAVKREAERLSQSETKPDGKPYDGFRDYLAANPVKGASKSAINRFEKLLVAFHPDLAPKTNEVGGPWNQKQITDYFSKGTHLTAEMRKAHTAHVTKLKKAGELPKETKAADVPMTKESTRTKAQSTGDKMDGFLGRINNIVADMQDYLQPVKDSARVPFAGKVTQAQLEECVMQIEGLQAIQTEMERLIRDPKPAMKPAN